MKHKAFGFILVTGLWVLLTLLCYGRFIIFDIATIGGAMVASLGITFSVLGILRLLKMLYDGLYPVIVEDENNKNSN